MLVLALATGSVWAQTIVHTVPPHPLYYWADFFSQDFDANNDGIADFNLSSPNASEINLTPLNNNAILSVPALPPDLGGAVYPLPPGTVISSSPDPALVWFDRNWPGGTANIVVCYDIGCLGYFQNGLDAYAGIRLDTDGVSRYGWIHIQSFGLNFGQISDWAYETRPDAPILAGAGIDSDHDGVWDFLDQCPDTPPGAVVDTNGCSIVQLCPCNEPWKNHGEYVKAVGSVAARFVQEGRITEQQRAAIVKQAANSDCGKVR